MKTGVTARTLTTGEVYAATHNCLLMVDGRTMKGDKPAKYKKTAVLNPPGQYKRVK
jgi:hypothetical protein